MNFSNRLVDTQKCQKNRVTWIASCYADFFLQNLILHVPTIFSQTIAVLVSPFIRFWISVSTRINTVLMKIVDDSRCVFCQLFQSVFLVIRNLRGPLKIADSETV